MISQAGDLDRRIVLQRAATVEGLTADTTGFQTLRTVWASKTDISDDERIRASQVGAVVTTRFQVRWAADVATMSGADRLEYPPGSGSFYSISGTKEIGRRDRIEITAARLADGRA